MAAMKIGVPNEIKKQEPRGPLLPSVVYQLVRMGHEVFVEHAAGAGAGFPDEEYVQAGAQLLDDHSAVFEQGDLIVKVKEPLPSEYRLLRSGQLLFTYLHLAANKDPTLALIESGVPAIAYETIAVNRRLPVLDPIRQ